MSIGDPFFGRPLEHLSEEEAHVVLERFLELGRDGVAHCENLIATNGVALDFGQRSLVELFIRVGEVLRFEFRPLPNDLPDWIREAPQHAKGVVEFDDASRVWILRVAFCLGEFFVRSYPQLRWAVGDRNFAEHVMPVIAGFKGRMELPPIVVTEGMFTRVLAHGRSWEQVTTMIKSWQGSV
ncbi:MAG: hypothetical protein KBA31_08795 [Alphaproteobacteria bacterium]|nr:hypothetical protein [Alphaproteobacteria bacterium]